MAGKAECKKGRKGKNEIVNKENICKRHNFSMTERKSLQSKLLKWYDSNQRKLPWRDIAKTESNSHIRGYAVWVSEVMLQQTQVATVISYYKKWMEKWPTVTALAEATLEDVIAMWAGLGYYSRARRLYEGAQIVATKLQGHLPDMVNDLMSSIPGIGQYTASAISSIAYQQIVGVVDGNVSRVLSRMRVIGGIISKPVATKHLWSLANNIVSKERPGDFNQALMELGALICTPRNPKCSECPISLECRAYSVVEQRKSEARLKIAVVNKPDSKAAKYTKIKIAPEVQDIEDVSDCQFCLSPEGWKSNPDVTAFPVKAKKKSSRIERIGVVVVQKDDQLLMLQRPDTGLLAGLWEFPSILFDDSLQYKQHEVVKVMLEKIGILSSVSCHREEVTEVVHIFSHIHTTYVVEYLIIDKSVQISAADQPMNWLTREEIKSAAVSTAMKKVLKAVDDHVTNFKSLSCKKRKRSPTEDKCQQSITKFFS